jgi:hypothetical protein
MVHNVQNLKDFEFNSNLEIQQHFESLKHVINIIIYIRDTGCYKFLHDIEALCVFLDGDR